MARGPLARVGLTGVEPAGPDDLVRARELARRFGVPVREASDRGTDGVRMLVGPGGLALGFEDRARGKPLMITCDLPRPLPRAHILRRALGAGGHVVDATAGFGGDLMRIASLGHRVTALERSDVVYTLLDDAIHRALGAGGAVADLLARVTLRHADACDALIDLDAGVIYLDAMFTKPKQTAKSPKDMQLLQELLGPPTAADGERLMAAALGAARDRVVVKRALKTRASGPKPSHTYAGQSVRYDVYVRAR